MSKRPNRSELPKRPGGPLTDREVLREARESGSVLLSKEGDFGRLIYLDGEAAPVAVLLTKFGRVDPEENAALLIRLMSEDSPIKIEGMFTIIDRDFIRQRPLPPRVQHLPQKRQPTWHRHRN